MTTKLSIPRAISDFIPKAKKKVVLILRALSKINCCDWNVFCKILDSQVISGILYASEIWGFQKLDSVERVQKFSIKRFLKLPSRTPSVVVYGETGRYPLYIQSQMRCLKYWLKLITLDKHRLPSMAYRNSYDLAEEGKNCWAKRMKDMLFRNGFGIVWQNQSVGNIGCFLKVFSQRLKDCFMQDWNSKVYESNTPICYKSLRPLFVAEKHILKLESKFRTVLLKIKAGTTWVKAHRLRFDPKADVSCPFCPEHCENVFHVFMSVRILKYCFCISVSKLRNLCAKIPQYMFHPPANIIVSSDQLYFPQS